jgi:hypothetical protein
MVSMSLPAPYPVALWLIPAPHHRHLVDGVIAELAIKYGKHSFPSHATLSSGDLDGADLGGTLRKLFAEVDRFCFDYRPFPMQFQPGRPVGQRPKQWNQFLFLPLDAKDAPEEALDLNRARQAFPTISNLKLSTDIDVPGRVMPHVSLMYSAVDQRSTEIAECAAEYRLPDAIEFTELWIVSPRSGNWPDFVRMELGADSRWDVIYRARLVEAF